MSEYTDFIQTLSTVRIKKEKKQEDTDSSVMSSFSGSGAQTSPQIREWLPHVPEGNTSPHEADIQFHSDQTSRTMTEIDAQQSYNLYSAR